MENPDELNIEYKEELKSSRIWASVEEYTRWKVKAFYAVTEEDKSKTAEDYLYVGNVIALNLSEM